MPTIQHNNRDDVQVRALRLPKDVHEKLKAEAAQQMRTIPAQAVFALTELYRSKEART